MLKKAIVSTVDYCARYATQVIGIAALLGFLSGDLRGPPLRHRCRRQQADLPGAALAQARGRIRQASSRPRRKPSWRSSTRRPPSLRARPPPRSSRNCPTARTFSVRSSRRGEDHSSRRTGSCSCPPRKWSQLTKKLGEAKPLIQALAQDSNLRGLTTALNYGLIGARMKHYSLDDLSGTFNMVADTLEEVVAGRPASFSWRAMLNGRPPDAERATTLHRDQAGARLFVADAGEGGDRRHPPGGGRPQANARNTAPTCGSPGRCRSRMRNTRPSKRAPSSIPPPPSSSC